MTKRIVSIVLLLTMLMSFVVPSVSAAEDEIYIDNMQITNGEISDELSDVIQVSTPETTEAEEKTTTPSVDEIVTTEGEDEPVSPVPSCDCGNVGADVAIHGDGCAAKQYYKTLCAGSAGDIYALWNLLPQDGQAFVKLYLSWTNANKLQELEFLISSNWENEEGLDGVATTIKDGNMIGAFGVPEDAQLQVNNATAAAQASVDAFVGAQTEGASALFAWDISVVDSEGATWQPDESVQVVLEVPGEKLHKYTQVYVIHVDDEGNAEKIPAQVTEDGKIVFHTDGFSTFAGYTVDFEYDGVPFSIPGETSILLSELMDKLKMPFYVEQVASAVFSTPELLSVTREGSDWRLTSLLPFQTNETLTLEMTDGKVYVIEVTDASYPQVKIGENGTLRNTNGTLNWYADGDGNLKNGWTNNYYASYANFWSQDYTIYVTGSGTLTINIHPAVYATSYYVNICQINVDGGAKVKIVMSDEFNTKGLNLTLQNMDDRTMFQVYNGSLEIKGLNGGQKFIIDGNGTSASKATNNPIIRLNKEASSLIVKDVTFRDGKDGGIRSRANELTTFDLQRCTFESTIKRTAGDSDEGGAILIMSNSADSKGSYVDIHNFTVTDCTFSKNKAKASGGAIAIYGYIHKGNISNCLFTGCTAGKHGGAIDLGGNLGDVTITNSTFENCTAAERGGGVSVRSTKIKNPSDEERWTRSNMITFTGCTFNNCDTTESQGGGIGVTAQVNTLNVMDCDFTNCDSAVNGGAISFDGQNLPDTFQSGTPNWSAEIDCTTCSDYGTAIGNHYDWKNVLDSSKKVDKKSWINTINITDGCTFTECTAANSGGAVEFANGLHVNECATISNATVDSCKAVTEASAIYWSFCYIPSMKLLNSTIQNCSFNPDSTGNKTIYGGTVKTTGNSTLVLDVQGCTFANNYSPKNGGGLYWNANRGLENLACKATVHDCLFDGNTVEVFGGAIFTESDIVITKCNIRNNKARMGGGIAQQVYDNGSARMLEAGGVTELKLDPTTWIHDNTAVLGGGVSVRANETSSIENGKPIPYTVRFELNGAAVYKNKALRQEDGTGGHGGGIYFITDSFPNNPAKQAEVDNFTKEILINQGEGSVAAVYDNYAEGNGGGIYMESSHDTVLLIEQGYISGNIGNNGGGIYMTGKNATCHVTGGIIGGDGVDSAGKALSNVAQEDANGNGGMGGGIAISGGARIEMDGGEISYNKVASNGNNGDSLQGGGIWLAPRGTDGVANTMLLKGGSIKHNSTPGGSGCDGGGVFVGNYGHFTINNGNIQHNTCGTSWGGGLYAYNATVDINGGDISENTAANGGGIFAHNGSAVTVTGGTIKSNSASSYGGGIYVYWGSDLTVSGGQINQNTAGSGGGIFAMGKTNSGTPVRDTVVKVQGGIISENVAVGTSPDKGIGGGIYAGNFCDVTISQSGDTVGKITKNTASRGGGVSVHNGAKLTVENGFITYNNALDKYKSSTATTTYHMHDGLYGVGGGIYVSNGYSDAAPSIVIVQGDNIGIYGNKADFAADDVFSNGSNTSLTIPGVQNMDLTEYEFSPEGWVEDYCNADTNYTEGTESVLNQNDYTNGKENVRYRISNAFNRMIIPDGKMSTAVNVDNAYVCMTLGIPAALPDTVVIDFGLPVVINMLDNDMMTRYTDKALVGIYNEKSIDTGDMSYTTTQSDLYKMDTQMNCKYGTIEVIKDKNEVLYTPYSMQMANQDVFSYSVYYGNFYYYADVNVIPATTIYYEDNFVGADGKNYITFSSYQYNVTNNKRDESTSAVWTDETCEFTCPDGDLYQDMDRIGVDTDDKLGNKDMDSNYGYDSGMTGSPSYSLGAAKKFVSSQNGNIRTVGEAKFTFTGTGFDVISVSSSNTGTITVQVRKQSDNSVVKNMVVDTYYGYTYSNGKWELASDNSDVLYQVPVIKCNNLGYDTYDVTITVSYMDFFDHKHDGSYEFYLDAIRIYDPANDGKDNDVIKDAYVSDKEGWPEYVELRNLLISRNDFDANGDSTASGIVFIDGKGNTTDVADYMNYGPNNEVYLQPGQAVAFNFELPTTPKVASVQIGLKSVGGTAKVRCYGFDDNGTVYALGTSENTYKTLATATDLYYDITDLLGKNIVVMNAGEDGDSILSITTIKVTYETEHVDSIEKACFKSNKTMVSHAIRTIDAYYANLKAPSTIDLVGASLSFEDEILTNLYYTTTNMADVAEGDMGLLTWSQMPETVGYDNAEYVYEGAVYVAESNRYMVQTDGIAAKELGDDIYMAVYAKLADGGYVYSNVLTYSPKQYAMSRLENSDNDNLKALCVAMLNYGAAAQTYFGYKTDDLMNADLTADQRALVADYDTKLFAGAVAADTAKVGAFAANKTGFGGMSVSVSFEGAFALNYYFAVDSASDVTFYYWTKDAYQNAEMLTAENASGTKNMAVENGICFGQISGVAAKQLDDTYYVAAVYTVDGETYCTGVVAYSLSTYCMKHAQSNMGNLAQATAVYGYHAKAYFG